MGKSVEWLNETKQRAELGDRNAQIALAWEYIKGELVEKDVTNAISLFRKAELHKPEIARFNLAKAKMLEGDRTFQEDILQDCNAGFGPALWLMGMYALRRMYALRGAHRQEALEEALRYFRLATQSGHLPSEGKVWRLERGLWSRISSFRYAARISFRMGSIKLRNKDDQRILT
jgi:TPR repeat protein